MNIMLVSVTERTREIGIRKSIGANAGDIALQFLIEATAPLADGRRAGNGARRRNCLVRTGNHSAKRRRAPVPWATVIAIAVGFSVAVGIGFGSYPAGRAGKLDPVEALRS